MISLTSIIPHFVHNNMIHVRAFSYGKPWRLPVMTIGRLYGNRDRLLYPPYEQHNTRLFSSRKNDLEASAVSIYPYNRLKSLAKSLKISPDALVKDICVKRRKKLFCEFDGVWFSFSSVKSIIIPFEIAELVAAKYKKTVQLIPDLQVHRDESPNPNRIPVIAFLGHFNHGKTSLLDSLGSTNYVSREKHGITQVIRTKRIDIPILVDGRETEYPFTVVDTPGQEIFFRMRNYGAAVADLVVLLVASDDGICPQTEESIGVAEGLGCPVIVCLNKIDKPEIVTNSNRLPELEAGLREYTVLNTSSIVPISATLGTNLDKLKELLVEKAIAIRNQSNQATQSGAGSLDKQFAYGTVVDTWTSQKDGTVLHAVIRRGEIKVRDWFTSGGWAGFVWAMHVDDDKEVDVATAGMAVKLRMMVKMREDPVPLEETIFFVPEEIARIQAEQRSMEYSLSSYAISPEEADSFRLDSWSKNTIQYALKRSKGQVVDVDNGNEDEIDIDNDTEGDQDLERSEIGTSATSSSTADDDGSDPSEYLVLKADTSVSLGTMYDALNEGGEDWRSTEFSKTELKLRKIVRGEVGIVTTADVMTANAANCPILAYSTPVEATAARLAQSKNVSILHFDKMQDVVDIILGHPYDKNQETNKPPRKNISPENSAAKKKVQ